MPPKVARRTSITELTPFRNTQSTVYDVPVFLVVPSRNHAGRVIARKSLLLGGRLMQILLPSLKPSSSHCRHCLRSRLCRDHQRYTYALAARDSVHPGEDRERVFHESRLGPGGVPVRQDDPRQLG